MPRRKQFSRGYGNRDVDDKNQQRQNTTNDQSIDGTQEVHITQIQKLDTAEQSINQILPTNAQYPIAQPISRQPTRFAVQFRQPESLTSASAPPETLQPLPLTHKSSAIQSNPFGNIPPRPVPTRKYDRAARNQAQTDNNSLNEFNRQIDLDVARLNSQSDSTATSSETSLARRRDRNRRDQESKRISESIDAERRRATDLRLLREARPPVEGGRPVRDDSDTAVKIEFGGIESHVPISERDRPLYLIGCPSKRRRTPVRPTQLQARGRSPMQRVRSPKAPVRPPLSARSPRSMARVRKPVQPVRITSITHVPSPMAPVRTSVARVRPSVEHVRSPIPPMSLQVARNNQVVSMKPTKFEMTTDDAKYKRELDNQRTDSERQRQLRREVDRRILETVDCTDWQKAYIALASFLQKVWVSVHG